MGQTDFTKYIAMGIRRKKRKNTNTSVDLEQLLSLLIETNTAFIDFSTDVKVKS